MKNRNIVYLQYLNDINSFDLTIHEGVITNTRNAKILNMTAMQY